MDRLSSDERRWSQMISDQLSSGDVFQLPLFSSFIQLPLLQESGA